MKQVTDPNHTEVEMRRWRRGAFERAPRNPSPKKAKRGRVEEKLGGPDLEGQGLTPVFLEAALTMR